ncbi:MAG TPA: clostripain-related cysteine peptidase [Gemmatimonadaceae bacterium]|nr:clostripain-related cysteine peptidase [Gemmatimonadaceae bacterium]
MVYLAADNNLAIHGVDDIDEMEAIAANPEVQVVIQGEFNPSQFARLGATAASAHLPNFNTFRYAFGGLSPLAAPAVTGPNGVVTDIGNRNMTDPGQLKEFVTWAKATYPAERYALVLWNHGDGFGGLIEDITSAGNRLMNQRELRAALTGTGGVDVIDFDMCQMAGYETLESIVGLTQYAAFSQANEPGEGDPYTAILNSLYTNPNIDGKTLSTVIVDQYDSYFAQNPRVSTTKSAFDLSGYPAFRAALDALGASLLASLPSVASSLGAAITNAQRYELPVHKDVVNAADSLLARIADPVIRQRLSDLRSAATSSSFKVAMKNKNGTFAYSHRVDRSSGLHFVLPSKIGNDAFSNSGARTIGEYALNFPGRPWTEFLKAWTASSALAQVDLGSPWEVYLVWDAVSFSKKVDIDLWVLEPNGNVYVPFIGTVTPNGHLSSESSDVNAFYEGYVMNRYVDVGRYGFYANLFQDSTNVGPYVDVQFRRGSTGPFTSLYGAALPRLSKQSSWLNDATPTFGEIHAGAYSDLRLVATLDVSAASGSSASRDDMGAVMLASPGPEGLRSTRDSGRVPTVSAAQRSTIERLLSEQRKAKRKASTVESSGLQRNQLRFPTVRPDK